MSDERRRATRRLADANDERSRLSDRLDDVRGTAGEFHATVQLRAAQGQVAARNAWIDELERSESDSA